MKSNIVLLTIDSLRADHLGCYGYRRNTSPHLDALAAESTKFERAFAAGIPTMPSFTTLLSGLHPLRHGITAHASEQRLTPEVQTLAQMAHHAGYVTVAIDNLATQAHGRGGWFARGFDYYSSFLYQPFSNQSEQLVQRAISYFQQLQDRPFLLWLHLWDPHSPYSPPAPFDTMHYQPQADTKARYNQAIERAPDYYRAFLSDMKPKIADDYDYVVAQYDGEISYVDQQCGQLFQSLKDLNLWDNSHVIALSDHGEAFGEGGVYFDHHGLYDAITRLTLLWKTPEKRAASTCSALISHEDITPTLIECCDLRAPDYPLTGQSLAPALRGEKFNEREFVISVESTRQCSLSVRTRDWKLIVPLSQTSDGRTLCDIYGNARDDRVLLFDLNRDSEEKHNVAAQFPERRDSMLQVLAARRVEENARRADNRDPLDYGLSLPYSEFMERLNSRQLRR